MLAPALGALPLALLDLFLATRFALIESWLVLPELALLQQFAAPRFLLFAARFSLLEFALLLRAG